MAIELPDGAIVPSYLGVRNPSQPRDPGTHTNMALRQGEVVDIVYPDSPKSRSGTMVEYVVDVPHADGHGPTVTTRYFGVPVANLFGGTADFEKYTLRKQTGDTSRDKLKGLGNGSKVWMLCVNGRTTNALILGGVRDPNQPDDTKDEGHNWARVFNGLSQSINKDGELTIAFHGATDINGDPADGVDTDKTGASLTFTKDGNWSIQDVPNNIVLKSEKGVLTGDATDHTILGDIYRKAEQQMHQEVSTQLKAFANSMIQLAASLGLAGTGLIATAPVAAAQLSNCVGTIGSMVEQINQAASAIDSFEADASDYLSKKNKSD